jgi:hypothetical protein
LISCVRAHSWRRALSRIEFPSDLDLALLQNACVCEGTAICFESLIRSQQVVIYLYFVHQNCPLSCFNISSPGEKANHFLATITKVREDFHKLNRKLVLTR